MLSQPPPIRYRAKNYMKLLLQLSLLSKINCSAPNLSPTPVELCQWTTVRGSIIIHNPTTLYYSLYSGDSHLLLRPTEKFNYTAHIRDIELKCLGYA